MLKRRKSVAIFVLCVVDFVTVVCNERFPILQTDTRNRQKRKREQETIAKRYKQA